MKKKICITIILILIFIAGVFAYTHTKEIKDIQYKLFKIGSPSEPNITPIEIVDKIKGKKLSPENSTLISALKKHNYDVTSKSNMGHYVIVGKKDKTLVTVVADDFTAIENEIVTGTSIDIDNLDKQKEEIKEKTLKSFANTQKEITSTLGEKYKITTEKASIDGYNVNVIVASDNMTAVFVSNEDFTLAITGKNRKQIRNILGRIFK